VRPPSRSIRVDPAERRLVGRLNADIDVERLNLSPDVHLFHLCRNRRDTSGGTAPIRGLNPRARWSDDRLIVPCGRPLGFVESAETGPRKRNIVLSIHIHRRRIAPDRTDTPADRLYWMEPPS
jgi:hypothetical protein